MTVKELMIENGGYWGHHPDHAVMSWQYLVANGDIRQGYWEWVLANITEKENDE